MWIYVTTIKKLHRQLVFTSGDPLFISIFYTGVGTALVIIIYSIIKFKYFKNARINFIKEFQEKIEKNKKIIVSNIQDVNNLNPYEFESFAREYFKLKGYRAWTTQKSHDNGADVVAEKGKNRKVIQVKHSKKSINPYAIYQVVKAIDSYEADNGVLFTNSKLTNGAILDSQRCGNIEVINGHTISKYLRNNEPIIIRK
ncbi:hypothetical protein CI105_08545 [Candidatus Izimaplasma bacterium ZiA1]|uniref:restriction endonuclease n=1 Tax=Candidatus Izimoplasma sp. ZiA1 TaxID=2024899 RepID=UPI000BAA7E52|nr:hypothetical protein CI105_08545 [Candidatus Izimaplasma bacterium ZiA1]